MTLEEELERVLLEAEGAVTEAITIVIEKGGPLLGEDPVLTYVRRASEYALLMHREMAPKKLLQAAHLALGFARLALEAAKQADAAGR